MKIGMGFVTTLLLAAILVLAACAPGAGPVDSPKDDVAQEQAQETDAGASEKTLFVGPVLVDCEGEGPMKCMLVREDPQQPYELFYSQIEGFEFEEGFEYELLLATEDVENPPAGGSSIQWSLVEEVDKQLSLEGNLWHLSAYQDAEGEMVEPLSASEITAEFRDGQVNGTAGCNGYFGSYEREGNQLTLGPMAMTEMACGQPEGVMDQEMQYLAALEKSASYEIEFSQVDGDQLLIAGDEGQTILVYDLTPTEGTEEMEENNNEGTLYVGPILVDCEGEGPMKCMLVREDPQEPYGLFYSQIEGFEFEQGYEYELLVAIEDVENPPAGGSSIKWTLVEEVGKQLSLEGNLWGLSAYQDAEGEMVEPLPGSDITAEFRDGQVSGSAGCNNYFGGYEREGNQLIMAGPFGLTSMFCGEPKGVMDQEMQYLATLEKSASFEIESSQIDGHQLLIADAEGETILVYELVQPLALEGTPWLLLSYNNGKGGLTSALAGSEITAEFVDGTVSGSASCNNYHAGYEVEGNYLSIGPAATTRMFCGEPEGIMDQESQYLTVLESVATYEIKADTLEMFDLDGGRLLTYQAVPDKNESG
jgi:heat shock protein HslJ